MIPKHGLANALARSLDQLVQRAASHPGLPVRQPLARGLRVDVLVQDGHTHLQISRDNVWPSPQEWSIVTRNFPTPVPHVTVKRIQADGRYYLQAQWQTLVVEQPEFQEMKEEG